MLGAAVVTSWFADFHLLHFFDEFELKNASFQR